MRLLIAFMAIMSFSSAPALDYSLFCSIEQVIAYEEKRSDTSESKQNYKNPLKGFSVFVFSAAFPSATKQEADYVNHDIKKCLSSFGKVIPSSLVSTADNGEKGIDLTGFAPGCFLHYEITDVTDMNGNKLGIFIASLTLTTEVKIDRTRQDCMPIVWSKNCFLKDSLDKKMTDFVSESLKCLLEGFEKEYLQVNEGKPTFNLYQS